MKTRLNKLTTKFTGASHHIHKTHPIKIRTPRREPKSETRYRILENTMRGYFHYSI